VDAARAALAAPRGPRPSFYGDGHAGEAIVALLEEFPA
jgi:hypothetical protein